MLDVDGVLNPSPTPSGLSLDAGRADLVRRLDDLVQIVWATTWSRDETMQLGRTLGLRQRTPALSYPKPVDKIAAAIRWVDRACPGLDAVPSRLVWIDDQLTPEAETWAAAASFPVLLVRPDASIGLTPEHLAEVREFCAGS